MSTRQVKTFQRKLPRLIDGLKAMAVAARSLAQNLKRIGKVV